MIVSIICGLTLVFLVMVTADYKMDGTDIGCLNRLNQEEKLRRAKMSKKELREENSFRNLWELEKFVVKENDAMIHEAELIEKYTVYKVESDVKFH